MSASVEAAPVTVRVQRRGAGRVKTALLVALVLLYPFHHVFGPLNVSAGDLVVAVVGVALLANFAARDIPFPYYVLPAFAMLTIIVASITLNTMVDETFFDLIRSPVETAKFLAAAMWMMASFWLLYDDFPHRIVVFCLAGITLATAFASLTVVENVFRHVPRPSGPFENPNIYGNYLLLNTFLVFGVSNLLTERAAVAHRRGLLLKYHTLAWPVVIPLLLLGALSTGSRGTLLGFCVGLPFALRWRWPRVTPRRIVFGILALFVLGGAVWWFLDQHPFVMVRLTRTFEGDGPNIDDRLALWRAAREAFYTHPLLGIGYGQFGAYAQHVQGLKPMVTHETYLAAAAELGIAGLLVFLWLLAVVMRDAWRIRIYPGSGLSRAGFAYVLATTVQGLTNNVDQFRALWLAFGIVAAMRVHAARRRAPPAVGLSASPDPGAWIIRGGAGGGR
ncbi:MAG TPA: O-antigen ligase family protein [Gemmatimonadaceae bacterium]|nr:O-antigen ligase family protein [Gemmatimonadaceae bacterium]